MTTYPGKERHIVLIGGLDLDRQSAMAGIKKLTYSLLHIILCKNFNYCCNLGRMPFTPSMRSVGESLIAWKYD
jgi:hypothetical protein